MGNEILRCAQHDKRVLSIAAGFWPIRASARLRWKPGGKAWWDSRMNTLKSMRSMSFEDHYSQCYQSTRKLTVRS